MPDRVEGDALLRPAAHRIGRDTEMAGNVVDVFLDEIYRAMDILRQYSCGLIGGNMIRFCCKQILAG